MGARLRDINKGYYSAVVKVKSDTSKEVKGTQTTMVLERGPSLSQKQLDKELQKLRLIVA